MKKIKNGIVFSDDISRILNGINAFDFKYEFIPSEKVIKTVREDFKNDANEIFNGNVTIVTEEEMLSVNDLIDGKYPHCLIG